MKRYALILTVLLAAVFVSSYSHAAEKAGQVITVKKDVYLLRDDKRETAKPQMEILEHDAVETGSGSRTKLFFIDDSILSLGEMSRVEVQEYMYSPEKQRSRSIYRLMDGALKVVVGRSDLEIHTPTAVAAARGTKFIVIIQRVADILVTKIIVLEGEVLVRSIVEGIQGFVTVPADKMTEVPENKAPEDVKPVETVTMGQASGPVTVIGDIESPDTELPGQLVVEPQQAVTEPEVPADPPVIQQPPVSEPQTPVITDTHSITSDY